jgi:C-lobe and N-lobe beta barrels of Tf-binding protein B
MRLASVSALVLTGFALAACAPGEMGDTTCANLNIAPTGPCVAAATSTGSGSATTTTPIVPIPTGTGTSTNTGNTTTLGTGDQTVALEFANLVSPSAGSISTLTETSAPNTAKLAIDTKSSGNSGWPIPKTMNEYVAGTLARGNRGPGGLAGATYKEYRVADLTNDEELQVWHWTNSYVTQYRDVTAGGGEARHQAWSFGGNATAAMPGGGIVTYNGDYGATAKTWNWVDAPGNLTQTISANGSWSIEGTSRIVADFGAHTIVGNLTPQTWTGWQTLNGASGFFTVDATNPLDKNFQQFMNDDVIINGTITGNKMTNGTASLNPTAGWVNGVNPAYAGFFGPSASEIAGAFSFVALSPVPSGSHPPINDDRRGFIQESGVFHAQ